MSQKAHYILFTLGANVTRDAKLKYNPDTAGCTNKLRGLTNQAKLAVAFEKSINFAFIVQSDSQLANDSVLYVNKERAQPTR